ncbi:NEUL4 protein, partial [Calcarius ornatus]|nr:NEUL4 protein [Calcarius ornatus]
PSAAPGPCQRFHGRCGQNVALAAEGLGAARVSGYCHGLVFSRSHLRPGELFEVGGAAGPRPTTGVVTCGGEGHGGKRVL